MASPNTVRDLKALKRLINQADLVLATIPNLHPSIAGARESLHAALGLATALAAVNPAAALGAKGGLKTAERGPEYFARIAAMRTSRKGGRPKNSGGQIPVK
ncbi:MAG TPA: hypothetical protein VGM66_13815 [Candidatus Udaeobacter sp.]|jgi:hypothetical protein